MRRICTALILATTAASALAKDTLTEVTSPHFIVYTDAGAKAGRKTALEFERIREVISLLFPSFKQEAGRPFWILALRRQKTLENLLGEDRRKSSKGYVAGLFLTGIERHYVITLLKGNAPRITVYHEYMHLVNRLNFDSMPLWLNEGLANFIAQTVIKKNWIEFGWPNRTLLHHLTREKPIPWDQFFEVDHASPIYRKSHSVPIFEAQAWAVVHYFLVDPEIRKRKYLDSYVGLLRRNIPEPLARANSIGKLPNLKSRLYNYIRRSNHNYFAVEVQAKLKEEGFQVRELDDAESTAVMAAYQLRMGHRQLAQDALEDALEEGNHTAVKFQMAALLHDGGKSREARELLEEIIQARPDEPLAHYRLGLLTRDPEGRQEHLRQTLKFLPHFAPAMQVLAETLLDHSDPASSEEAEQLLRKASQLEPAEARHKLSLCRLLLTQERPGEVVPIAQRLAAISPLGAQSEARLILEEAVKMKADLANRRQ